MATGKKKDVRKFTKRNGRRRNLVYVCLGLALIGLAGRVIWIDTVDRKTNEKAFLSSRGYDDERRVARRGDITDRNGTVLATNEKIYRVILDARVCLGDLKEDDADRVEAVIYAMDHFLGIDAEETQTYLAEQSQLKKEGQTVSAYNRYLDMLTYNDIEPYLAFLNTREELTEEEKAQGKTARTYEEIIGSAIWFDEGYRRVYPYNNLACDVLGYMENSYEEGLAGLEYTYNDVLRGVDGKNYSYMDDNTSTQMAYAEPQNGKTVVTTLDMNIQRIVEQYIEQFENAMGAKNVAAIVMDPNNGEVLAMATGPSFNLNSIGSLTDCGFTEAEIEKMTDQEQSDVLSGNDGIWRNFCLQNAFDPGSVAKCLTVAYALEQGIVKENDKFICDGGESFSSTDYVSCNGYHDELTLSGTLAWSCNDAMMQIAEKFGAEGMVRLHELFGMGQYTGIDLPGEQSCENLIFEKMEQSPINLAVASFGQGSNMNMMQMAAAFCSLINGGYYYQPHVVEELQTDGGSVVEAYDKTLVRQTVSEKTCKWMREALIQTVTEGTGKEGGVPGYVIGGKTGTTEKLGEDDKARLVSFISAAPMNDPQIMVYVVVDEAYAEDQGLSSYACKIVSRIYAEVLPYLGIYPTETITEEAQAAWDEKVARMDHEAVEGRKKRELGLKPALPEEDQKAAEDDKTAQAEEDEAFAEEEANDEDAEEMGNADEEAVDDDAADDDDAVADDADEEADGEADDGE